MARHSTCGTFQFNTGLCTALLFLIILPQTTTLKRLPVVVILFFIALTSFSQDSCHLKVSLLTCAPGEELYSTFGHTAIRVQDPGTGNDLVYNYGTFEFGPDFYSKFIRGKLLYYLSVEYYNDFRYLYQLESRSIQEQELNLSCAEKQKLFAALQVNALEANRYYRYDFLFDNCTTRARDIIAANTASVVVYKNILPKDPPSFRDLIHSYLDAGHQPWSKLGIDLLLGAKLDRRVTNQQAMFLPDYLLKGLDSATTTHPLVARKQTILQMPSPLGENPVLTPAVVFTALLLLIIVFSFMSSRWAAATVRVFDFLFFFILGLAGLLLLFMWFGTDHTVCQNNYNLFWALPTHVVAAFFVHSKRRGIELYFRIVTWISLLLLLAWFFIPQTLNNALLPVVLLIVFRSWHLSNSIGYARKNHYPKR